VSHNLDVNSMPPLLARWFGFRTPVDRRTYVLTGVLLMLVKYFLDGTIAWAFTGQWWAPWRYLWPLWSIRMAQFAGAPATLYLCLGLMTLPFFWIGVSMSVRRAANAGLPALVGLGFAAPGVNFFVMLALSLAGSASDTTWKERPTSREDETPMVRSALTAVVVATMVGVIMGVASARGWFSYGFMLFFATPLVMGVTSGYLTNRPAPRPLYVGLCAAVLSTLLTGGALLLFALEGVVCVAMAAPIALAIALLGALIGRAIAIHGRPATASMLVVLASMPLLGFSESRVGTPVLHEVRTMIDIDAPPDTVWENVIGFADLPAPSDWVFSTGIAYPMRARVTGAGVGAIRSCEFSTGAFIEPITAWEPGRRLAFDVLSQPPAMREWSFYAAVHPPHLDTLLRSRRGEFRLIRRQDGGTRLEGRTWYTLSAAPSLYWCVWSDAIIHRIHGRVLAHVKRLSEAPRSR
jgi:hypothetical protein